MVARTDINDLRRRYQPVPLDQEELDGASISSAVPYMTGEEPGKSRLAADQLCAQWHAAFFVWIEDLSHVRASTESIANALELDAE